MNVFVRVVLRRLPWCHGLGACDWK